MRGILLVARRDFAAYVNTIWGWVILAIALFLSGALFVALGLKSTPQYSSEVLSQFYYLTGGVALTVVVFTTMRLFAEERQTGTIVLLETSPLGDWELVLGKYLSAMMFLALFLALTAYMPLLIFWNGKVSGEELAVGYSGILLMGSAGVAIGTWASSVARNQLLALVVSGAGVVFFLMSWMLSRVSDPPFKAVISYVAFYDKHFKSFQEGRVNTEAVFFFASVSFAFLLLATQALRARRWE